MEKEHYAIRRIFIVLGPLLYNGRTKRTRAQMYVTGRPDHDRMHRVESVVTLLVNESEYLFIRIFHEMLH